MSGKFRLSCSGALSVALCAFAAFGFGGVPARAQDAPSQDPPARVGYVSLVEGTVSLHPSANDPWAAATVNYPMTAGSSLWTEPGGKAEIQIGAARVDLDGGTEVDIVAVDDHSVDINVPQGRVDVRLHDRQPNETYEVTVPRGTVALNTDGTYRITAGDDQNPTQVGALYGNAQLIEPSGTVPVETNNELVVSSGDPLQYTQQPIQDDGFDHWVADRTHSLERPVAHRYTSPQMVGADNLDQYGTWQQSPQYGAVWYPSAVDADWAPYREGRWSYVGPWGWTWVDDEPWGFAPFHYGRWAYVDDRWGWVPGEEVAEPVYAPALVAFVGGDPGIGVGVSIGIGVGFGAAVGWVPLGPDEVYEPWYHHSDRYIHNVNITNVSETKINNITVNKTVNNINNVNNITNVNNTTYVNQRAVTAVNRNTFVNAQPVRQAALPAAQAARFTHPIAAAAGPAHANALASALPQPTVASRVGSAAAAHPMQAPPQAKLQMPTTRTTPQGRVVPTAVPAAPAARTAGTAPAGAHPAVPPTAAAAARPNGVPQPHAGGPVAGSPVAGNPVAGGPIAGTVPHPGIGTTPTTAQPRGAVPPTAPHPGGVPQPHPVGPIAGAVPHPGIGTTPTAAQPRTNAPNATSQPGAVPQPHPAAPIAGAVPHPGIGATPTAAQPRGAAPTATPRPGGVPQPHPVGPINGAVPHPGNGAAPTAPFHAGAPTPAARPNPVPQAHPAPQSVPTARPAPQPPTPIAQPRNEGTRFPAPQPQPQAHAPTPATTAPRAPAPVHVQPQARPAPPPPAQYHPAPRPQPQVAPRPQPQAAPRPQAPAPVHVQPQPRPQPQPQSQPRPQPQARPQQPHQAAPHQQDKNGHPT
ncbi:hypothetical protein GCM10011611_17610 [Aliidongia dinghuensis]|uniref:FecR protein n=1 Tax=Aliidongia dinghuensis TaxID=1867774 RepID=A0A8J2YT15_9PROT|nr:DUF6600 domain-containing protein [Aliidongia dinghuensis]GGF12450.1 hypothetical protein GCM10011611_17610 [Aliidongia dinghuensis]